MQTTPAAADIQAAFAKFMEQAVHTAVSSLKSEPAGVVLPDGATPHLQWGESRDYRHYTCSSTDGRKTVSMQMERTPSHTRYRNVWYGSEMRTDDQGRTWSTSIGRMVQDDFGFLVAVTA